MDVLIRQTIKHAHNLSRGDTFFKSGVLCRVLAVSYDGVLSYQWEDAGEEPDGPYLLYLSPENDDQTDDWSDVEVPTDSEWLT